MTLDECRRFYADEVRFAANIDSAALIEAFASVPREKFLGPPPWKIASAEQRAMALMGAPQVTYRVADDPRHVYHNVVIGLLPERDINNGQPSALARWIEALDLQPGNRVYHLGCGVGYYTAIMAEVVGGKGKVSGSEMQPELASRAAENLSSYPQVQVHQGDGVAFDPGECDAIFVNAGVTYPHRLWLDRLTDGGRLVLPITFSSTSTLGTGAMVKIVKTRGSFSAELVTFVGILSCSSLRDRELEASIRAALSTGGFMKMKSVRVDAHEKSDTCVLHASDVCFSAQ
jgi:protein-L-isoaspartate(D-aspartate) O-methyltransferase